MRRKTIPEVTPAIVYPAAQPEYVSSTFRVTKSIDDEIMGEISTINAKQEYGQIKKCDFMVVAVRHYLDYLKKNKTKAK